MRSHPFPLVSRAGEQNISQDLDDDVLVEQVHDHMNLLDISESGDSSDSSLVDDEYESAMEYPEPQPECSDLGSLAELTSEVGPQTTNWNQKPSVYIRLVDGRFHKESEQNLLNKRPIMSIHSVTSLLDRIQYILEKDGPFMGKQVLSPDEANHGTLEQRRTATIGEHLAVLQVRRNCMHSHARPPIMSGDCIIQLVEKLSKEDEAHLKLEWFGLVNKKPVAVYAAEALYTVEPVYSARDCWDRDFKGKSMNASVRKVVLIWRVWQESHAPRCSENRPGEGHANVAASDSSKHEEDLPHSIAAATAADSKVAGSENTPGTDVKRDTGEKEDHPVDREGSKDDNLAHEEDGSRTSHAERRQKGPHFQSQDVTNEDGQKEPDGKSAVTDESRDLSKTSLRSEIQGYIRGVPIQDLIKIRDKTLTRLKEIQDLLNEIPAAARGRGPLSGGGGLLNTPRGQGLIFSEVIDYLVVAITKPLSLTSLPQSMNAKVPPTNQPRSKEEPDSDSSGSSVTETVAANRYEQDPIPLVEATSSDSPTEDGVDRGNDALTSEVATTNAPTTGAAKVESTPPSK
ncbi:MAG: hypothetical protein LQ338_001194 [Usnochroma carphineum]|nr:MAG: hypothetical protein LQ338_001194 [Usnochroma carphineum]